MRGGKPGAFMRFALLDEGQIILPVNHLIMSVGIICIPVFRGVCRGSFPFYLIGKKLAPFFFNKVYFLLIIGSPEIRIGRVPQVFSFLKPFGHDVVLPKFAKIIADSKGVEVLNQGIADSGIDEIAALVFGDFLS